MHSPFLLLLLCAGAVQSHPLLSRRGYCPTADYTNCPNTVNGVDGICDCNTQCYGACGTPSRTLAAGSCTTAGSVARCGQCMTDDQCSVAGDYCCPWMKLCRAVGGASGCDWPIAGCGSNGVTGSSCFDSEVGTSTCVCSSADWPDSWANGPTCSTTTTAAPTSAPTAVGDTSAPTATPTTAAPTGAPTLAGGYTVTLSFVFAGVSVADAQTAEFQQSLRSTISSETGVSEDLISIVATARRDASVSAVLQAADEAGAASASSAVTTASSSGALTTRLNSYLASTSYSGSSVTSSTTTATTASNSTSDDDDGNTVVIIAVCVSLGAVLLAGAAFAVYWKFGRPQSLSTAEVDTGKQQTQAAVDASASDKAAIPAKSGDPPLYTSSGQDSTDTGQD